MSSHIDVRMLNAFHGATVNVLSTMCGTTPEAGKPLRKTERTVSGDVSSSISLTGHSNGMVVLSFSKGAITTIVSRMLMEQKPEIDGEVKDALGELTNMIAGDSRKRLEAHGIKYEAGLPNVIIGSHHEVYTVVSDDAPTIVIPFKTDTGDNFCVEFTILAKN